VTFGPVVAGTVLAVDKVVGTEQRSVRVLADRLHRSRLEVDEDGARDISSRFRRPRPTQLSQCRAVSQRQTRGGITDLLPEISLKYTLILSSWSSFEPLYAPAAGVDGVSGCLSVGVGGVEWGALVSMPCSSQMTSQNLEPICGMEEGQFGLCKVWFSTWIDAPGYHIGCMSVRAKVAIMGFNSVSAVEDGRARSAGLPARAACPRARGRDAQERTLNGECAHEGRRRDSVSHHSVAESHASIAVKPQQAPSRRGGCRSAPPRGWAYAGRSPV
jgi:hypothetical protein